jgi:hypothetical protein
VAIWRKTIDVKNIPCCIEIATNNECAEHIEMKVIFGIIVAVNERFKPFDVRELSKRSQGTIDIEALLLDS